MADISDVEQALADTVASILYPAGSSASSIVGLLCRVYRGWPNSATLNTDLSTGAVNVTVVTDNDPGRTTTRYLPEWQTKSLQPGVVATTTEQVVSISGSPSVGDVVGLLVDGNTVAYRIQYGDTLNLVASNLSQLIPSEQWPSVHGTNITLARAISIVVRVVCDHSTSFESRRQEKDLRVICWCPTPSARDAVAATIDAGIDRLSFLGLPDATNARVTYRNTSSYDQAQNALLYRRDLIYMVEYATTTIIQQPSMIFGGAGINGDTTYG